jgi:hypothetical protein
MLIHFEGVRPTKKNHSGEHVPLDFQPAIRTFAEHITARSIAGADHSGQQDKPIRDDGQLGI